MTKKNILMLVPHEPSLDPRIDWEASYAAKKFKVTVIGIKEYYNSKEYEIKDNYIIIRKELISQRKSIVFFFYHLMVLMPLRLQCLALGFLVIFSPLIFFLTTIDIAYKNIRIFLLNPKRKMVKNLIKDSFLFGLFRTIFLSEKIKAPFFSELSICSWYVKYFAMIANTLWSEVLRFHESVDLIHCNDIYSLLIGVIARSKLGIPVVYDTHEYMPYSDPQASKIRIFLFKIYEKFLIKKIDHVITVNPLMAHLISKDYGLNYVYSVPNSEPWKERKNYTVTKMSELANGRIKFLFQGNFAHGRGIEDILRVWQQLDKTKAALFLRGPHNPVRQKNIDLAEQLGLLNSSVYFLDAVSENILVESAKEADVGIIPYKPIILNHIYACPNKLSQYMHAGLLIISNNLLYIKQILAESKCGMIYSNEQSLVDVLRMVIENDVLREKYKENALSYAENVFNWQKHYRILEDCYITCLN